MLQKYRAKNGMRIILEEIPSVRSVTVGVWTLAGARNEEKEVNGISHLIEHMMFKGTKRRNAQQIAEEFDSIGGQVNAFTSREYTCYYARVIDTYKEKAVEVLSDMFFNSVFDETELEKEKKVVLEEINMYEDAPDDIVHDLLAKAAFGEHSLGYPILGAKEQLLNFTRQDLLDYISIYYNPENVVISIAGNVNESFIPVIEGYFDQFENSAQTNVITAPQFIAETIQRKKETEQAHLTIGYEGLSVTDEQLPSLAILNNVLGGSMSSRLFQEVREEKGLAYSVFSHHSSYLDTGLLTIYAGTGKASLHELKTVIDETINTLATKGLTDKELINSKEQLKGQIMLSLENTSSRMMRNGRNELLLKHHKSLDDIIKELDLVSAESIKELSDYLFKQKPAVAVIAPESL